MKPLMIIIALLTEPPGSILDLPWDHVSPLEVIEERPIEDVERDLKHRHRRIMDLEPGGCPE